LIAFLVAPVLIAAKKGDAAPAPSAIEDLVNELKGCGTDVLAALMGAANDAFGYLIALPRFGTDCFVWAVTFVRDLPALGKNVFNGNQKTLDELTSLCVTIGSICFVVYISVAAINMGLQTLYSTKEYFSSYLTLPAMKTVLGQDVPKPVTQLRDTIQKEMLDRIINWKFAFVMPLSGEKGSPSIGAMVANSAAAISLCMMLSCAPAVLALMQNGPSKGDAEAVAYTMGTALGIQYLVNKAK
jgi:hypothetical protein